MNLITLKNRGFETVIDLNTMSSIFLLISEKQQYLDYKLNVIDLVEGYANIKINNSQDLFMDTAYYNNGNNSINNEGKRVVVFNQNVILEACFDYQSNPFYLGFKNDQFLNTDKMEDFQINKINHPDSAIERTLLKTLTWYQKGKTGLSSKALAYHLVFKNNVDQKQLDDCGIKMDDHFRDLEKHPRDPSDFKRCLDFFEWVPEAKQNISEMKAVSPQWNNLIDNWDSLETLFNQEYKQECNQNKTNETIYMNQTYEKMKTLLSNENKPKNKTI